ncbi:MAG: zinc ribbon domain-containing protein [Comamonadaceae bacterium]|nr:zinc ribbon domain-containing protein [Comamonadaceae bacterium]
MPIYAYKCEACGFAKDVLQKISDPLLKGCPACGKASFSKQLTAAGFQLKGSGWYATDFKGNGSPAAATAAPAAPSTEPATATPAATPVAKSEVATATPASRCSGGCACHS